MRSKFLSKFKDVFQADLGPNDRLNVPPFKIQMNDDPGEPFNAMKAIETPCHLLSAANNELSRLLKPGLLEPVSHPTVVFSCNFCEETDQRGGRSKSKASFRSEKSEPQVSQSWKLIRRLVTYTKKAGPGSQVDRRR